MNKNVWNYEGNIYENSFEEMYVYTCMTNK
jgi:hypothetical protein